MLIIILLYAPTILLQVVHFFRSCLCGNTVLYSYGYLSLADITVVYLEKKPNFTAFQLDFNSLSKSLYEYLFQGYHCLRLD